MDGCCLHGTLRGWESLLTAESWTPGACLVPGAGCQALVRLRLDSVPVRVSSDLEGVWVPPLQPVEVGQLPKRGQRPEAGGCPGGAPSAPPGCPRCTGGARGADAGRFVALRARGRQWVLFVLRRPVPEHEPLVLGRSDFFETTPVVGLRVDS